MARYVSRKLRSIFSHHHALRASTIKRYEARRRDGRKSAPFKVNHMERLVRERRKRERVDLQCPVQLFTIPEGPALEATTVNLSCDGVYWVSNMPFSLGERIQCSIHITPPGFRATKSRLLLHCRVRIVRVEESAAGFGIGCQIEESALFPSHQNGTAGLNASSIGELATTRTGCD